MTRTQPVAEKLMRGGLGLMGGGFLAVATPALSETLQQFDLSCGRTSYIQTTDGGKPVRGNTTTQTRLHVDLVQKRFCEDDCRYVRSINWASTSEISLRNDNAKFRSEVYHVERTSGDAVQSSHDGSTYVIAFYKCSPAPFTGLELRETPKF